MHVPPVLPTIELAPGSLIIADLHLDLAGTSPDPQGEAGLPTVQDFLAFLDRCRGCPRLVILGDLFEAWFTMGQARNGAGRAVVEALRSLVQSGTAIELVHGNRDFLLGPRFAAASGCRVHAHGILGLSGGKRMLLIHGDELCTLDHSYQRMKRLLRSAPMRGLVGLLPEGLGQWAAQRLRQKSRQAVAAKSDESKAMQESACRALAEATGADLVLCGHAHAFGDRNLPGGPRWVILDAFGGSRDLGEVSAAGELWVGGSSKAG